MARMRRPFSPLRRVCVGSLAALATGAIGAPAAGAHVIRPWPADKPAPSLDLADLDGRRWTLTDLKGKVVVMNFWASWCEPCAVEMPSLSWLADQPRGEPLVLGVNYQEHEDKIRRFIAQVPVSFPILLDRNGEAARAWTPRVFPSTVVLGRQGRPAFTVVGEYNWAGPEAQQLLQPVMRRASVSS